MSNPNPQPRSVRTRARALAVAGVVGLFAIVGAGCNDPKFLIPGPTLRGITIPLPPPSFADEVMIRIDVEGNIPLGYDSPGTLAFLKEKVTDRGYFVETDGVDYTIYDVLLDVNDNCLEVWFVDPIDDQPSTPVDYKAVLRDGAACSEDTTCSAPDELGVCLCLEKWTVGC